MCTVNVFSDQFSYCPGIVREELSKKTKYVRRICDTVTPGLQMVF